MKPSATIMLFLVISLAFVSIGFITNDFKTYYGTDINTTWESQYDYSHEVNQSVYPLQEKLIELNEAKGFINTVISGGFVLLEAVALVPGILFTSLASVLIMLTNITGQLGVPAPIVAIFIVMSMVAIIFGIMNYIHRWQG